MGNWGGEIINEYMPYINYTKKDILAESIPFIKKMGLDFNQVYKNTTFRILQIKAEYRLETQVQTSREFLLSMN